MEFSSLLQIHVFPEVHLEGIIYTSLWWWWLVHLTRRLAHFLVTILCARYTGLGGRPLPAASHALLHFRVKKYHEIVKPTVLSGWATGA